MLVFCFVFAIVMLIHGLVIVKDKDMLDDNCFFGLLEVILSSLVLSIYLWGICG